MIRYKYLKNKNKDTILFLHGWGGDENSLDIAYNHLMCNYSVLSINLSDITNNYINKSLTMHDYLVAVISILHRCGVSSCHIVCHSFGFRIALLMARDTGIHIDSMVVIDGAGIKYQSVSTKCMILKYKVLKKIVYLKILPETILKNRGSADYNILSDKDKSTFKNIVNYDLKSCVKYVLCNTTIIWGRYDCDTPISMARYLHRHIANSRLIVYNTGHFSYLDNPIEFIFDIDSHFIKYYTI